MRDIEELIIEIKEKMLHRDLSDEYLREHNHSTREEIGIGEYAYGITMIPCEWILPFLEELELAKEVLKDKCEIADERNQLLVENQKKDNAIKNLENRNRKLDLENQKLFEQSLFQDKVIDEMTNYIANITDCPAENEKIDMEDFKCDEECSCDKDLTKRCWKKYFIKKVE